MENGAFRDGATDFPATTACGRRREIAVLARQRWDNAGVRRRYLDGVAAKRRAKQSEMDTAIDRELEPQKIRLRNEWLANNPNFNESDFEKRAWIHLRQNLIEQRNAGSLNAEIAAQMAKGIAL